MRQQSQSQHQSHSGYSTEPFETRKERMDKKRAIRKNKVGLTNDDSLQIKQDKKFLTKQQKAQLQKAKNRQAAQRSRDQHKKYVETLEEENLKLREQLAKPRYCQKCSREILSVSGDSTDPSLSDFPIERHLQTFVQNQNNQECEDFESPFIRMNDYEDSSPLKMFLLISMIMVGVFLMSGSTEGSVQEGVTLKRDLMEIPIQNNGYIKQNTSFDAQKTNSKQILQINKFELLNQMENSFNMLDDTVQQKVMTEVVPLTYQLSPLSQESCLKSIIENNYTELSKVTYSRSAPVPQRNYGSLRSDSNSQVQVFSSSAHDSKNNVLFCSLPKLYRKSQQVGSNLFSKFIDIIISGSEMMEILGKSPNLWMNKIVNFNGIYKINAQVKEIVQIQDSNCIL